MPYLLNLLYVALLVAFAPILFWKGWKNGKYRAGWSEKFLGKAPKRIGDRPCVWFHAVSVGEVLLLKPILVDLARRRPDWHVVISTTTTTGLAVARRTFPDLVTFYAPLDFSWATRRAMARVRPTLLALVELELWPNLIAAAKHSGARVAIINGRLSGRSHRGYRKIRWALRKTLWRIDTVAAQTEEYASRFVDLGVPDPHVRVTGSVKYDGLESSRTNGRTAGLRKELGLSSADLIFVAGSTMEGEEEAALAAYRRALSRHPRLRLVLVPRHAERFEKLASWLTGEGLRVIRRSQPGVIHRRSHEPAVILIDTLGELSAVWGLADVAFVGGSLFPGRGGQNMMEAAAYGPSVIFGPHTSNFKEAVEGLLARGGARRVADAEELASALAEDLDDPETASRRGAAGREFVLAQDGASVRTVAELDRLVSGANVRR
ncbi:MAG: 3-deoxy-D-manno-octulosonic-acid transferase [Planctomycetota bacterium]|nr:3-deoxy-D-manno-octulosonic-acid transferase [Planctomycetota bacterium]